MQAPIILGFGIAAIGIFLCIITTKWQNGWFFKYKTTNRPLSFLGIFLLIIGIGIAILAAYFNGQLD